MRTGGTGLHFEQYDCEDHHQPVSIIPLAAEFLSKYKQIALNVIFKKIYSIPI